LNIARSLAARGVRRLILMGRTPLPPREQWSNVAADTVSGRRIAAIRELEAEGLSVHVASVDVGNESQLREFLDRYKAEAWPPICGVIHAAGAFNNQLAGSLSQVDFDAVVGPKLRGAQYLARSLPDLDLFVLISSTGAFLVQSGQANYAAANTGLDAVAQNCHRDGLHALSIGWGVWQNTELVSDDVGQRNVSEMARQGIGTISPERGVNIFAWLCGQAKPHIIVLPIDWAKYRHARAGRENPMLKNLYSELPGTTNGAKLKERLAALGQAERRQLVGDVVKAAVAKVLKIPPSRIDPRKAMGTMGLSSLLAMELRNHLEAELERPLSATLAWNYPTVEALVAYLAGAEPAFGSPPIKQSSADLPSQIQGVMDLSDEQALAALRGRERTAGVRQ
jgi:acyl carrier protein/NADP-dependent 3-hydroxy acid dehydrogenase YdfG